MHSVGKNRNPFVVFLLSIVTFGIYCVYWYYKINDEIRQHDPSIEVKPGIAAVALFVPIANLVSYYNTAGRIRKMEEADQVANPISPVLALVLIFLFGIGYFFVVQGHLNAHWDRHRQEAPQPITGAAPAGTTA